MQNPRRQPLLDDVLRVVGDVQPLVDAISSRDRDLATQIRRALSSVALNLAEGFGSRGGSARVRFESARGSLYEAHTGLRLAVAWGYLTAERTDPALESLRELGGRIHGLARK